MGELQLTLLYRMSTGWYDRKGLAVLTGIKSCDRIIPRLIEKGYIETHSLTSHTSGVTLYRRTSSGAEVAYSRNKYFRQESRGTCQTCGAHRKMIVS